MSTLPFTSRWSVRTFLSKPLDRLNAVCEFLTLTEGTMFELVAPLLRCHDIVDRQSKVGGITQSVVPEGR
jgi:hypothetical protein